ncbi:hypothetical protein ACWV26_08295 [Rummeliibacillus sp. JY-2-4R]
MNYRSKILTISLACTITMGFISHNPTLAASAIENKTASESNSKLDAQTKQKVDTILSKLDADLAKIGVPVHKHPARGELFKNLDENTKAKAKEILKKAKEGTITRDEAHKQLKALGIEFPKHHKHEIFKNLDENTKVKVKKIMENVKSGAITKEEAHKQLKALGVEFSKHPRHEIFKNLDANTKVKVKKIMENVRSGAITKEEAHKQLKALGIDFPKHERKSAPLDTKTKEKAKSLINDAKVKVKKLGAEFPSKKYDCIIK